MEAARSIIKAIEHGALGDIISFSNTPYEPGSIDVAEGSAFDGLPLVVIECKAPDIADPVDLGIKQLLRYQNRRDSREMEGVPELFYYNQFMISTCNHTACYSTITGKENHFIEWKDPYPCKLSDIKVKGTVSSQELLAAVMPIP
jgi:type I restriction enzyme R subunit